MMPGLLEGQEKMSKSDPNSAIFMEDSEADVSEKGKPFYSMGGRGGGGQPQRINVAGMDRQRHLHGGGRE